MGPFAGIDAALLQQRGHLFPWLPVCLALGIGAYFALPKEPGAAFYASMGGIGLICAAGAARRPGGWSALGWGLAMFALGAGLAGLRAHSVAGPVLGWRYYGPVEGRIVAMDRSASDALRLTLDHVRLRDVARGKTPDRVRISLHGPMPVRLSPGQRVMTTAHLSPPQGPVEPGGFDFRRHAWFQSLGAVGYTRVAVLTAAPAAHDDPAIRITALRLAIAHRVRQVLPGDVGGFAAAVTTGDRSGVSQARLQALRDSNLAHLLAISGLHMGLLAGFVFAALRIGLSLFPSVALRLPVRKIAAFWALIVAAGYLGLSGGNVATERAFVMTAVVLGAVLADRRALSIRAVAVAALIVLTLRPESLLGPGFQMSFAATTALVAVFGWLRGSWVSTGARWQKTVLGLVLSSAVAGLATSPIGAAHFNTMSHYGLLANLLCVPLMGLLVIPSAVLALCLAPVGAETLGLWLMGAGLQWILWVAHSVADLPGAVGHVASPPLAVLPLIALGALWVILWQGRGRIAGALPVAAAFVLWTQTERPVILIADTGGLVGVLTEQGRALSKPKGAGFVAGIWLENDGDIPDQVEAASRWPEQEDKLRVISAQGMTVTHVIGKRATAAFNNCLEGQIVVFTNDTPLKGPCDVFDPKRLQQTGAIAVGRNGVTTAKSVVGRRIWAQ